MVGIDIVRPCALSCGHTLNVRIGMEAPIGHDICSTIEKEIASHSMQVRKGICSVCKEKQDEQAKSNSVATPDASSGDDSAAGPEAGGAAPRKQVLLRLAE